MEHEEENDGPQERRHCWQCGRDFVWSPGEQRFFAERGLASPKKCVTCRKLARIERAKAGQA